MNGYRFGGINQVWIGVTLIHIVGPLLIVMLMGNAMGMIVLNSIFWLYCAYANRQKKAGIICAGIGWSITMYLLNTLPISYSSAFALNLLLFLYMFYLHYGNVSFLMTENQIRRIKAKDLAYIVVFTILLLVIGGFVNACSMYAFPNYAAVALAGVSENIIGAILVLALVPAVVEELIFRGYIFGQMNQKGMAVILSAMLFSLCHMNFNQMCYALVIGIFLALIFYRSGNLVCSMGVHFLFNLYAVLTSAYGEHALVQKILTMKIGNYAIWNASVVDASGKIEMSTFVVGLICFVAAIILLLVLLRTVKPSVENTETEVRYKKEWKPNVSFVIGIVLCLAVAFLQEM